MNPSAVLFPTMYDMLIAMRKSWKCWGFNDDLILNERLATETGLVESSSWKMRWEEPGECRQKQSNHQVFLACACHQVWFWSLKGGDFKRNHWCHCYHFHLLTTIIQRGDEKEEEKESQPSSHSLRRFFLLFSNTKCSLRIFSWFSSHRTFLC